MTENFLPKEGNRHPSSGTSENSNKMNPRRSHQDNLIKMLKLNIKKNSKASKETNCYIQENLYKAIIKFLNRNIVSHKGVL